jgi:hypothetical protein
MQSEHAPYVVEKRSPLKVRLWDAHLHKRVHDHHVVQVDPKRFPHRWCQCEEVKLLELADGLLKHMLLVVCVNVFPKRATKRGR